MFQKYMIVLICTIFSISSYSQIEINGTVVDETGELLIGVNIIEKGSSNGTVTDFDGVFSLEVTDESAVLQFSYIGYQSLEIPVANRSDWNITMSSEAELLEEVVVVGYGVQRKSDLTGAINRVEPEELTKIATSSLEQALQGKVAGVQVISSSGEPGRGAEVRIRGVGTLNNSSPLYVVDGMLLDDISFVNMQDVESIEVLKDASATAIYGSRGANGVIIISTKKGQIRDKPSIQVGAYSGWQEISQKIDLTNALGYATLANELAANEKRPPIFDNPEIFGEGVDWQDQVYRTAPIRQLQISALGGNEKVLYNISANYFGQDGIQIGSDYERYTFRINNEYTLTPSVRIGHNFSFIYSHRTSAPDVSSTVYRADPTIPPRDENGAFNDLSTNASTGNPIASIFYANNTGRGYRAVGNAFVNYNFLKNFTLRSSIGIDLDQNKGKGFTPVFFVSATQRNEESVLSVSNNEILNWLWENTMTYDNSFGKHRFTLLAGITAQEYTFESLSGTGRNLIGNSDEFLYLDAAQSDQENAGNNSIDWAMNSYLFRANYVFDDRFLFTGSIRADGSSRFGESNRWGYFPSFAAGWNLSNETFMQNVSWLSRLKFRASWGVIGNDKIGAYPGRPVVSTPLFYALGVNEDLNIGSTIEGLPNDNIQWEETAQSNFGFEFGLLDNRLQGELDYYRRVTDKILIDLALPGHFGIRDNFPFVNAAKVENTGIDLKVDWREKRGKLNYNLGIILSTVDNEVLELGEGKDELLGGSLGTGGKFGTRTVVGLPIGAFYGYQVAGVFQNQAIIEASATRGGEVPGDLQFVDVNGDGEITTDDRTYLGSPIPDLIYGFNAGFEISGFDFSINFNGQSGNKIYNAKKMARFGTYNFDVSYLDRWTGEGTSNSEPRITNGGHNYEESERFVEDGSFMRLRNISMGYSLPQSVLTKIGIERARIYVTGTNLFTWTDYTGYTPEIAGSNILSVGIDRGVYPVSKNYNVGIDVNF